MLNRDAIQERKKDTRQKIIMGGLVVKAGLSDLHATHPEVILGMLMEVKDKLNNQADFSKWRELGLKEMFNK